MYSDLKKKVSVPVTSVRIRTVEDDDEQDENDDDEENENPYCPRGTTQRVHKYEP